MKRTPTRSADRRHLEAFLAVIDRGSFAAAGRELGISQSAISQSLRQLEAIVGSELFVRTARPFNLTAAGRAAEPHARRSLQDLDAFMTAASPDTGLAVGRLTICTIPTQSAHPVAGLVGAFRAAHPRVRVDIIQPPSRSIADVPAAVRGGLADVGITEFPTAQHGLRSVEFESEEFVAVLPPHADHREDTIDAETFASYGIVIGPYFETSVAYALLKKQHPNIDSAIKIRTDHRESFQHLVAEGLGATLMSREGSATARRLGCRTLGFRPPLKRRTGLVYPSAYLTPPAAAFVEVCRSGDRRL
ncbi:LysR family transcriptional regulator [Aeromicrobium duanguangcaii]|uniref:LysR family transcriptional regulator n=1 Tax=Aeromicrobium duanguangcaii TaxID=2968086 RepID=A0ABY5KGZ7_9ACTN|nr:LysR family transcriptional regulator [Aeromicrobium duanguangcaii]MCD9153145.1 LysR family transcriptional regulator [Aeromicrobium duanguangcaii]UUI69754.1 LysR family transcriptional regulator [Aeromicrobium duanguangcaii]